MALVSSMHLSNTPATTTVHAALFADVSNAQFLHQQLLDGNSDFEYAFIDASRLLSTAHILAAIFRALNDWAHARIRTRNIHAEIVFSLSPNNNIAESFRRFGIGPESKNVLAIKIASAETPQITAESVSSHLREHVKGTPVPFDDAALRKITDLPAIRKIYKLNSAPSSTKGSTKKKLVNGDHHQDPAGEVHYLESVIFGIMALKGS